MDSQQNGSFFFFLGIFLEAAHRSCPPGVQLLGAFRGGTLGLSAAWGAPGVAKWTMWAFVRLGEVGRGVSQRGLLDGGLGRSSSKASQVGSLRESSEKHSFTS